MSREKLRQASQLEVLILEFEHQGLWSVEFRQRQFDLLATEILK